MRRSNASRVLLAAAAIVLAAGCPRAPELPGPILEAIEPAAGRVGAPVAVTLRGRNFFVRATPSLEGEAAQLDDRFTVRLGGVELSEVRRLDERTLSAVVPPGLPVGRHGVELQGPYGGASLAEAWEALAETGAALAVSLRAPAECVSGERIELELEVENRGDAAATAVNATFRSASLTGVSEPGPAARIAPGATETFVFSVEAGEPGEAAFEISVAAADEASGESLAQAASGTVQVRRGALLTATLASPARVSLGQELAVELTVTNSGQAAALAATPSILVSGDGAAERVATPAPQELPAGESRAFLWRFQATAAGTLAFEATAEATEAGSARPVSSPAQLAQTIVERAAALSASLEASPSRLLEGESLVLTLVIVNRGEASATGVVPSLTRTGSDSVTVSSGPTPASAEIAGGGSTAFTWEVSASARGTVVFEASAVGSDANSGRPVAAGAVSAEVEIARRAELIGALTAPAAVNAGQELVLDLVVTNTGDTSVNDLTPGTPTISGDGSLELLEGPLPAVATVGGGSGQRFTWRLAASGVGTANLSVDAAGVDALDGRVVPMPAATTDVAIQAPAALSAELDAPRAVGRNTSFTVTLTVSNAGGAHATGVVPAALGVTGTSGASVVAGPDPASEEIPGGASRAFRWTLLAGALGDIELSGAASGQDANDGAVVGAAAPGLRVVVAEATELFDDPFGDGTSASFVFAYGGKLYLAPDKSGSGAVRANPDGSAPESVAFSIAADTSGANLTGNDAPPPYPSFGRTGCAPDTLECGPDNEDGRGLFTSGSLGGTEWLIAGGSRSSGGLDYVYLTSAQGPVLDFSYVDLNSVGLSGQTKSLSSACVVGDRVYLAFPDSGGNRPYLLALLTPPAAPGLDAVVNVDALQLDADRMPDIGRSATLTLIDTMAGFEDRLYLFNNGGCARATVAAPARFGTNPGDWAGCTPVAAEWSAKTSVTVTDAADLTPADRAVPQVASHQGRLYAARNTTAGPQLWGCDPAAAGDPVQCDPGDWSLVAANSAGDPQLTQFDNPANTRLTLLVSTGSHLFVGFDNAADGVVLFRSAAAAPASRADFEGLAGCGADAHPAACEGLSGNGLGDPANSRVFSAVGAQFGGQDFLYLTAGDGVGALRVFRIAD